MLISTFTNKNHDQRMKRNDGKMIIGKIIFNVNDQLKH